MIDPVTITQFRDRAGPYFSTAVHRHQPLMIQRGASDRGLLIGEDEVLALLADRQFNPEVLRGEGSVSIWLPELEIYGQGSSYAEAKEDLLSEVRYYVEEFLHSTQEYLVAPNRAGHLPYVIKAYLADLRGQLTEALLPGPPATLQHSTAPRDALPAP
jgi:hypothetical protein